MELSLKESVETMQVFVKTALQAALSGNDNQTTIQVATVIFSNYKKFSKEFAYEIYQEIGEALTEKSFTVDDFVIWQKLLEIMEAKNVLANFKIGL